MTGSVESSASERLQRLAAWGELQARPLAHALGAGRLRCELMGSELSHLRVGDSLILRSLQVVVRDRNWGTVPGLIQSASFDGPHAARLSVRHVHAEVDFEWQGRFALSDHELVAEFAGLALRNFACNRIGWCLIHPLTLSGADVEVRTIAGERYLSIFPVEISPHQPFRDIHGMRYRASEVAVEIEVEGDTFETEDHRNWTDAGYKTYSTPLEKPFPVLLRTGDRVSQRVTVKVHGGRVSTRRVVRRQEVTVEQIGNPQPMPRLGLVHRGDRDLSEDELAKIAVVGPSYVQVEMRASSSEWNLALSHAAADARRLRIPLVLSLVCGDAGELASIAARCRSLPVSELFAFDAATHVTTPEIAREARASFAAAGTRIGGGSRTHFAELNRALSLPLRLLDTVTYSICAEMHSEERAHVRETVAAQPATVRQARRLAGERQLVVGPVGFKPRFNSVATGKPVQRAPGCLPDSVDPRQGSVFGAAWTVSTIAALSAAGADAITLHEMIGWRGLIADSESALHPDFPGSALGEPFPVWHILRFFAAYRDRFLPVRTQPEGALGAFCAMSPTSTALLLANLGDDSVDVRIPGVPQSGTWRAVEPNPDHEAGWSITERRLGDRNRVVTLPSPSVGFVELASYRGNA